MKFNLIGLGLALLFGPLVLAQNSTDSSEVIRQESRSRSFQFSEASKSFICELELANFSWHSAHLYTVKGLLKESDGSREIQVVGFKSPSKMTLYEFQNKDTAESFLEFEAPCMNIWDCEVQYHGRKDFIQKWVFEGESGSHILKNGDSISFHFPYPRPHIKRKFEHLKLPNGDTINLKPFMPMRNFSVVAEKGDRVILDFRYTSNTFNPNGRCGAGEERGLLSLQISDSKIVYDESFYLESCYQGLYFSKEKVPFENDFYYEYIVEGDYGRGIKKVFFRPGLALVSETKSVVRQEPTLVLSEAEADTVFAQIEDLKWIAGHWEGEAFGGTLDEVWLPPSGESMLGAFKLVIDGKDDFKELLSISETEEGSLELSLRHFNKDLVAWEEKDEVLRFPLLRLEKNRAYFKSFTFERIDAKRLNIHVLFTEDGKQEVMSFEYHLKSKLEGGL